MIGGNEVVALLGETVHALARLDAPELLRLESWALELERTRPEFGAEDARRAEEKVAVLKLTLEATAANMRLLRRLRGEEEGMPWVR